MKQRTINILLISIIAVLALICIIAVLDEQSPVYVNISTISENSTDIVYVKCTGDAEIDTITLQAAIDNSYGQIIISGSDYLDGGHNYKERCVVEDTLIVAARKSLQINGLATYRTILEWQGPKNKPMFQIEASRAVEIKDLWIKINKNSELVSAVDYYNLCYDERCPDNWRDSSHGNIIRDVVIDGSNGKLEYGVRVLSPPEITEKTEAECWEGGDCHNEEFLFERVEVLSYIESGFLLEGRNSKAHVFMACRCRATNSVLEVDDYGKSCVSTVSTHKDTPRLAGSFYWYGGIANGNKDANFVLGYPNDAILISGLYSEKSRMLLRIEENIDGTKFPITIESARFSTGYIHKWDHIKEFANPEGIIVDVTYKGPLTIRGSDFGSIGQFFTNAAICWRPPYDSWTNQGSFIFEGNSIATSMENPFNPQEGCYYPTTQEGNLINREDETHNRFTTLNQHFTELDTDEIATFDVAWIPTSYENFKLTGSKRLYRLQKGEEGQTITIIADENTEATVEDITQSDSRYANIHLTGSENYVMEDGDSLTLMMIPDDNEEWYEISRSDK